MTIHRLLVGVALPGLLATVLAATPRAALAHCDTMDGPVVRAARAALSTGDPSLVLMWVQKKDEAEVRTVFTHTRAVRKLGLEAKRLADQYFFETVVRLHRAGEGEPYTGIKPAGLDHGPAIPAADRALASGNVDALEKLLTDAMRAGVRERFRAALAAKSYPAADVVAGREYVGCYVEFIHYVELLHQAAQGTAAGHLAEGEPEAAHVEAH